MLKDNKIVKFVSIGGVLTSISVLFQSAPVFLPIIGLALSPLSTLPIFLSAAYDISCGILILFSSALILILISPQEAVILIFTTGLLGVISGSLLFRKGLIISILISSIVLSLGMLILTFIIGIPAFGDLTDQLSVALTVFIFNLFSIPYVSLWNLSMRRLIKYLIIAKIINYNEHQKCITIL